MQTAPAKSSHCDNCGESRPDGCVTNELCCVCRDVAHDDCDACSSDGYVCSYCRKLDAGCGGPDKHLADLHGDDLCDRDREDAIFGED